MVFVVWLDEFCILHAKLQTVSKILEENLVLDTINNIKKFMIPVRSMDIGNREEKSDYKHIKWYKNGRMQFEYSCENGLKHEIGKGWYYNGQKQYEHNYKHGLRHGLCRNWFENGQINYEENYENGLKQGVYREWYENGQIKHEINYEHGRRHGNSKEWNLNGQLQCEYNYENGILI